MYRGGIIVKTPEQIDQMAEAGRIQARTLQMLRTKCRAGITTAELDEVAALADRVAVMYRGRIVGVVPPDTSREVLGLMMAGVPADEALATASSGRTSPEPVEGQR